MQWKIRNHFFFFKSNWYLNFKMGIPNCCLFSAMGHPKLAAADLNWPEIHHHVKSADFDVSTFKSIQRCRGSFNLTATSAELTLHSKEIFLQIRNHRPFLAVLRKTTPNNGQTKPRVREGSEYSRFSTTIIINFTSVI